VRLPCRRGPGAYLDAFPVYANGPTGLISLTIQLELGDHLTVEVDAESLVDACSSALPAKQLALPEVAE
jgi:hypothetical protein